ncbi:NADPH-dependent mycothiol reductase MTR [Mycobacterium tuberculosis]|nr:NADPH-dependent mycothiol reductase MTR [Mycobacterium tuberculosis]
MTGWVPDVLPGYWQCTIPLGPDPDDEGDIVATLVGRGPQTGKARGDTTGAHHTVLAVHGYTDYFFHTELADHFANRGFAFYALDLRKCGRSRAPGQTPHFITDLARYDTELEHSLSIINEQNRSAKVLVYGHSAGGLIVSLWLDRLRQRGEITRAGVTGLVLNSPFLDLQGPAILRLPLTSAFFAAMARMRPKWVARPPKEGGYGCTLHRDYDGEFDYNLQWKPVGGFPVTFGWIHASRRGHARLHRGIDVGVPNLILCSDHTVREKADPATLHRGDAVLDVTHIPRWAGCIGNRSTVIAVADAKHDVFLSLPQPRQMAYRRLDLWLDDYLGTHNDTDASASSGKGGWPLQMETYDIAIIGTGSGNSILDERYASKRAAICEQGTFGGTCLNVGCIPTKMFVYAAEVAKTIRGASRYGIDAHIDRVRWDDVVSRVFGRIDPIALSGEDYRRCAPNIDVYRTHTRFGPVQADGRYLLRTDAGEEFTAEQVVIAAGSRPVIPPAILASGVDYHTSDTVMRIAELPEHIVIVGSGFIAAEFAHVFSALGVRVTLVIRGSCLLRHCDDTICERFTRIASTKWELRTHRNVVDGQQRGSGVALRLDDGCTINADLLLVATGRVSNADLLDAEQAGVDVEDGRVIVDEYQRTSARGVFALGDVSSPYLLKHVANHEARVVQHNLLCDWEDTQSMIVTDHRYVPAAVFTDPQIAAVGLTENQAVAKGLDISVKIQDYGDVAYGWAMEDTSGIVKLITERGSGRLLGAHIMGYQASSLIQPLIQAMSFGLTAAEMARGQYWIHPALPEVVENALLGLR